MATLSFRLRLAAIVAVIAAAAVPTANAGLISGIIGLVSPNCGASSQVFAQWGDPSMYYGVQNGGFENGSAGWTLTGGAAVVKGNEPFLPTGTHSLSLPAGSSATSPSTCIGTTNTLVRMFASDARGTDQGLHVRIVYRGLLSQVLGVLDFTTLAPDSGWAPSGKILSLGALPVPLLGSSTMQMQLTPVGSGSAWLVDDLYVDPLFVRSG